ncbi:peroxiredoxin [Gynuella sunshinyii]|uniref:peroxiredoxin n=1 Tax=Gynuella sunshinyii TaxID=1445505 RepID=UPI0005CC0E88|nr:peroxiredoxin [Gynuella sunshinyii]
MLSFKQLEGKTFPPVSFLSTNQEMINIGKSGNRVVLYVYPRTTPADGVPLPNWDVIPGARGCSIQARGFASFYTAILNTGISNIYGLSTQDTAYQQEAKSRLDVPFELLSDPKMLLAKELNLPTFSVENHVLYQRITFVISDGVIEKVFAPIKDAADNAREVLAYLNH